MMPHSVPCKIFSVDSIQECDCFSLVLVKMSQETEYIFENGRQGVNVWGHNQNHIVKVSQFSPEVSDCLMLMKIYPQQD